MNKVMVTDHGHISTCWLRRSRKRSAEVETRQSITVNQFAPGLLNVDAGQERSHGTDLPSW